MQRSGVCCYLKGLRCTPNQALILVTLSLVLGELSSHTLFSSIVLKMSVKFVLILQNFDLFIYSRNSSVLTLFLFTIVCTKSNNKPRLISCPCSSMLPGSLCSGDALRDWEDYITAVSHCGLYEG